MILSVGANPAFDYVIHTDGSLNVGGLNRVTERRVRCGGKGVNFVLSAKKLAAQVTAVGFMPAEGRVQFERLFDSAGIKHDFVDCEGTVRTNIKVISTDGGLTEFNEKGGELSALAQRSLLEKVAAAEFDLLAVSGSLPLGVSDDFYYKLASNVANTNGGKPKPFACDCAGAALLHALCASPVLIKPNKFELESLIGYKPKTYADTVKAARTLIGRGAKSVLVSMGAEGAIMVNGSSAYYAYYPLEIDAVNPFGCGDAMFAAACDTYLKGGSLLETAARSVAFATLAVSSPTLEEMEMTRFEAIMKNVKAEAI